MQLAMAAAALLCFTGTQAASAQTLLGIKGSFNLGRWQADGLNIFPGYKAAYVPGWGAGIAISHKPLNSSYSWQGELHYSYLGNNISYQPTPTETRRYRTTLHALQLPVLLKYSLNPGKLQFNIQAGLYGQVVVAGSTRQTYINGSTTIVNTRQAIRKGYHSTPPAENFMPTGFGLLGGFGLAYPISNITLTADVRLSRSITNTTQTLWGTGDKAVSISLELGCMVSL